jgi:hypothetical protein
MKIGILTMHRVLNCGSALQAYALQKYISDSGHEPELIDYLFPNKKKSTVINKTIRILKDIYSRRFKAKKKFKHFYKNYYNLSSTQYESKEAFAEASLKYDLLLTGSDQVWNPIHIKDDFSFFFPYAPLDIPKYSYAASFSASSIPSELKPVFSKYLKSYAGISVREKSGITIVEELTSRTPKYVCDPTLLLNKEQWTEIAKGHEVKNIKGPYILVYILGYAYNPYPDIWEIIKYVQSKLSHKVIIIDGKMNNDIPNCTQIKHIGPLEFVNLIKDSSFIITTSFHGTAFALNFEKPFFSVIKDYSGFDTRIVDLLKHTHTSDRVVIYNKFTEKELSFDYQDAATCLNKFRHESMDFINNTVLH